MDSDSSSIDDIFSLAQLEKSAERLLRLSKLIESDTDSDTSFHSLDSEGIIQIKSVTMPAKGEKTTQPPAKPPTKPPAPPPKFTDDDIKIIKEKLQYLLQNPVPAKHEYHDPITLMTLLDKDPVEQDEYKEYLRYEAQLRETRALAEEVNKFQLEETMHRLTVSHGKLIQADKKLMQKSDELDRQSAKLDIERAKVQSLSDEQRMPNPKGRLEVHHTRAKQDNKDPH